MNRDDRKHQISGRRNPHVRLSASIRRATPFLRAALVCLLTVTASASARGQLGADEIEILSKEDAHAVFAMSQADWLANVDQAVQLGAASPWGDEATGLGMATLTEDGDTLIVRPLYEGDPARPAAIQVVVGYRGVRASNIDDAGARDVVRGAARQMAPEYQVVGEFQRTDDGLMILFMILPAE